MRAKFLRKEKSRYWGYDYYFECIDCGEEYTSMRFDDRTTPYCGACWRKHSLERKKIREKQKKQAEINEVLDKIRAEIEDTLYVDSLIFGELIDFKDGKISADDVIEEFNRVTRNEVLQIIDEYKAEGEEV